MTAALTSIYSEVQTIKQQTMSLTQDINQIKTALTAISMSVDGLRLQFPQISNGNGAQMNRLPLNISTIPQDSYSSVAQSILNPSPQNFFSHPY